MEEAVLEASKAPKQPFNHCFKMHQKILHDFTSNSQGQLLTFYDSLAPEQQQQLLADLEAIDPAYCNKIFYNATHPTNSAVNICPPPVDSVASTLTTPADVLSSWHSLGMQLIAANKVAVVLMAGGQGTRLGSSLPKGCFNIGLPSNKSLFQLQAERILKIQELSGGSIMWYIMTSAPTRKDTEAHFEQNEYFGLRKGQVRFFNQGTLPCFDMDGKILLQDKHKVAFK